jgi:hypothetical protein
MSKELVRTVFDVIRVSGPIETHDVYWPRNPGYSKLAATIRPILNGSHLEHVSVIYKKRRADMFVDDEGRTAGLPRNDRATAIYREWSMSQRRYDDPEDIPWIAGTAIIFHRLVWF